MRILTIDIGGRTRNGFCCMDTETREILEYSYLTYEGNPLEHRIKVLEEVRRYRYFHKVTAIVFEKINLHKGGHVSHLSNILSLCKLQTTLIDNLSDVVEIFHVDVRSWKSRSLGSANANKDDSLEAVRRLYPDVNLEAKIPMKRVEDKIEQNHDLADAIMISVAISMDPGLLTKKSKLNYT